MLLNNLLKEQILTAIEKGYPHVLKDNLKANIEAELYCDFADECLAFSTSSNSNTMPIVVSAASYKFTHNGIVNAAKVGLDRGNISIVRNMLMLLVKDVENAEAMINSAISNNLLHVAELLLERRKAIKDKIRDDAEGDEYF